MSARVVRSPFSAESLVVPDESFVETTWRTMSKHRTKLAVVEVRGELSITYGELMKRAESVAGQLSRQGCQRHDVIGIFAPNCIDWVVVCLAAMRIGATAAGVNALLTAGELNQQLQVCSAKYIFTIRNLASVVLEVAKPLKVQVLVMGDGCPGCVDISPQQTSSGHSSSSSDLPTFESMRLKHDDAAFIFFSSGTTGPSKGVVWSDRFIQYQLLMLTHPRSSLLSDVQLIFTPMSHALGFLFMFLGLASAATNHVMAKFDLDCYFHTLEKQQIERVLVVPPVAAMMVKNSQCQKYRLPHLRDLLISGAAMKADTEDLLLKKFPRLQLRQAFGMTEAGSITSVPYEEGGQRARKPGSVGVPLPNILLKVVDIQTGELLGPGSTGELYVKSPAIMLGYISNPEATAATIDSDGWLHTGDFGYYDEDGYFFIVDRLKELIKYNAYQVPPAELEAVLMSHPDVDDAGVIGLPDQSAGELPLAWVVRKPSATVTEQQLRQFVDEKVAPYKRLRGGVRFTRVIPRTSSGKILRRQMRTWHLKAQM